MTFEHDKWKTIYTTDEAKKQDIVDFEQAKTLKQMEFESTEDAAQLEWLRDSWDDKLTKYQENRKAYAGLSAMQLDSPGAKKVQDALSNVSDYNASQLTTALSAIDQELLFQGQYESSFDTGKQAYNLIDMQGNRDAVADLDEISTYIAGEQKRYADQGLEWSLNEIAFRHGVESMTTPAREAAEVAKIGADIGLTNEQKELVKGQVGLATAQTGLLNAEKLLIDKKVQELGVKMEEMIFSMDSGKTAEYQAESAMLNQTLHQMENLSADILINSIHFGTGKGTQIDNSATRLLSDQVSVDLTVVADARQRLTKIVGDQKYDLIRDEINDMFLAASMDQVAQLPRNQRPAPDTFTEWSTEFWARYEKHHAAHITMVQHKAIQPERYRSSLVSAYGSAFYDNAGVQSIEEYMTSQDWDEDTKKGFRKYLQWYSTDIFRDVERFKENKEFLKYRDQMLRIDNQFNTARIQKLYNSTDADTTESMYPSLYDPPFVPPKRRTPQK